MFRRREPIIIFVGPTATGKTTLMKAVCKRIQRRGGRCVYSVSEPFGGLTYLIITLLFKILLHVYKPSDFIGKRKRLAVVEIINPNLLSKLLPLIILLDLLSTLLKHTMFTLLKSLGFTVLVEDYIPQMMADHIIYFKLYRRNSRLLKAILRAENRLISSLGLSQVICVYINVSDATRIAREYARSKSIIFAIGFYNRAVRGLLVKKICNYMCFKTVEFKYS